MKSTSVPILGLPKIDVYVSRPESRLRFFKDSEPYVGKHPRRFTETHTVEKERTGLPRRQLRPTSAMPFC